MSRAARIACLAILATSCGPSRAPTTPGDGAGGPAACPGTRPIVPGIVASGTTSGGSARQAACGAGGRGPEEAFSFRIEEPARVRLVLETQTHDGLLVLVRGCGPDAREIACNEDAGGARRSMVWLDLEPDAYTVYADGSSPVDAGPFTLSYEIAGTPPANDTCQEASALETDMRGGSTFAAGSDVDLPCVSSPGGPDLFYRTVIEEPSLVSAEVVSPDFPAPVIGMARECSGPWDACSPHRATAILDPGSLFIAVDSMGADLRGAFGLSLRTQPVARLEELCDQAPELLPGKPTEGSSQGTDEFRASCGDGARGPESIHRLVLEQRSHVLIELNSHGHDGVLHVRSGCVDPDSEVACDDDTGNEKTSRVEVTLDPGTYHVFVDGLSGSDAGAYSLLTTIEPVE